MAGCCLGLAPGTASDSRAEMPGGPVRARRNEQSCRPFHGGHFPDLKSAAKLQFVSMERGADGRAVKDDGFC